MPMRRSLAKTMEQFRIKNYGMRPILGGVLRNRPEIRGVLKIALKSYDFEKSTWNPGGT